MLVKISGKSSAAPALGTMMLPIETVGGAPGRLNLSDLNVPLGIENTVIAHAGGGQGSATPLTTTTKFHRVSVCTTAGDSVLMPACVGNDWHYVRNDGATACQIYGNGTDTINGAAAATGIWLPPAAGIFLVSTSSGTWTTTARVSDSVAVSLSAVSFSQLAYLNVAQAWTKLQNAQVYTLTYAASHVPIDLSQSNQFRVRLTGNFQLDVPTGLTPAMVGAVFDIDCYQDEAGGQIATYAWCYDGPGHVLPVLSTTKCALDMLSGKVNAYNSGTMTVTIATPGVGTMAGHGFFSGQKVQITTAGALPTGLAINTTYWLHVIDANTFHFCTSLANVGSATYIATSGTQSGVHTMTGMKITLVINKDC